MSHARYDLRPTRPDDEPALVEAFRAVFGRERSLAHQRWLTRENPAGSRSWVATHAGRPVAQYAALPERVWIDGRERIFSQIVDSLVLAEHRSGLKRPGLFVELAREACAAWRESDWLIYGLPLPEAWRIGQRFLDYQAVSTEFALILSADRPLGAAHSPGLRVEREHGFDQQAKWLWDRCAPEWPASAIRDAAFLTWRYLAHPERPYVCLGARDDNQLLRGLAVVRRADFHGPDLAVLVDWLVPSGEVEVGESLLRATLEWARSERASKLATLLPPWSDWFARFQERGFRVHPTNRRLAVVPLRARLEPRWLAENWWWTLGDTDLA